MITVRIPVSVTGCASFLPTGILRSGTAPSPFTGLPHGGAYGVYYIRMPGTFQGGAADCARHIRFSAPDHSREKAGQRIFVQY